MQTFLTFGPNLVMFSLLWGKLGNLPLGQKIGYPDTPNGVSPQDTTRHLSDFLLRQLQLEIFQGFWDAGKNLTCSQPGIKEFIVSPLRS